MKRLGIVTGMRAEARIAVKSGCPVAVGGGLPIGARRMAERLAADGATALISFGLAGGLDPDLPAGSLVAPARVISGGRMFICDPALRAGLGPAIRAIDTLLAGDQVVAVAVEKQSLWEQTGAAAVDLESGAVAEVAAAEGLPFIVLRAICDPAARTLPRAAVEALDAEGRVKPMKMAGMLIRHPVDSIGLIGLARDAALARRALIRGAESLRTLAAGDANLGRTFGL